MSAAIGAGPGMVQGDRFVPPELKTREDRSSGTQYFSANNPAATSGSQADRSVKKKTFTFRNDLPEDVLNSIYVADDLDLSPWVSEDEYKPSEEECDSETSDEVLPKKNNIVENLSVGVNKPKEGEKHKRRKLEVMNKNFFRS